VGFEYLSLNRRAETLFGGEAHRIRLAHQLGSRLIGVIYILDEPTITLHQRDNNRLLKTLSNLVDVGNTVIGVEHNEETILTADHVVDIGKGAGVHSGKVIFQGQTKALSQNSSSITGKYLTGKLKIAVPKAHAIYYPARMIGISGARQNILKP
jgi:excinuclease ABC subunit A